MSAAAAGGNVVALFAAAALRRGSAPAILDAEGRVLWTFEGLADAAARLAGGLARAGLQAGNRVLVLEPDPRRRFAVVAGSLWAGATVVAPPASLRWPGAVTGALAANPTAVAFGPRLWPVILGHAGLRTVPLRIVTQGPRLPGATSLAGLARDPGIPPRDVAPELPALASFTTGSSGPPQLVLRSHDLLRAQHDALGRLRNLDDGDRDLAGLPFLALHDLASGIACVLPPTGPEGERFGDAVARAVDRAGATSAAGFPRLFAAAANGGGERLGGLRSIHVGGSRVTGALLGALAGAAPRAEVTVVYGSTEVEPIAAVPAGEYLDALAGSDPDDGVCAGRVVPGIDLRIGPDGDSRRRRDSGGMGDAPAGSGEILVRGPRAAAVPGNDGWAGTGDAGRLDDDGRLWLLGRIANRAAGRYPFQVERAVEALDWVGRAALVRLGPDPDAPGAVVVEPRHWDPGAVAAQARAVRGLAGARGWALDDVRVVRALPILPGPAGKVDTVRLGRSVTSSRLLSRSDAAPPGGRRTRPRPAERPSNRATSRR